MQGVRSFSFNVGQKIMAIEPFDHSTKNFQGYMVSLGNKEVRVFRDQEVIFTSSFNDNIIAMKYGIYGMEPNCLVAISHSGGLHVKILKRSALLKFSNSSSETKFLVPPVEQNIHIKLPKKSKRYLDQVEIEKKQYKGILKL